MLNSFLRKQLGPVSNFFRRNPERSSCQQKLVAKYIPNFSPRSVTASKQCFQGDSYSFLTPSQLSCKRSLTTEIDFEPHYTHYETLIRRLYDIPWMHQTEVGIEKAERMHALLGNPMQNTPVVHVAGSNGKGSVAMKIAKAIEAAPGNLKVGLFVSPHVSSFRERMQINGQLITEEQVVEYLPRIYNVCDEHKINATGFEIIAVLAFLFFKEQKADVIVLETLLGGRLDATNIVAKPAISVITSIALEHTHILGDTLEKIAKEKGGIIKKGCPVLCGPHVPHDVLRECANEKEASKYYTCDDVLGELTEVITDYDKENARIAESALSILQENGVIPKITPEMIQQVVSKRPPCRFELVESENGVKVILDVAHNPPAMEYLIRKLIEQYPNQKYRFVVGMSAKKDLGQCFRSILKVTSPSSIHIVEAQHPRSAKIEDILEIDPSLKDEGCFDLEDRSITKQLHDALTKSKEKNEMLVVCGSVFLMAESREALGFDEPRDSDCIKEVAGTYFRRKRELKI